MSETPGVPTFGAYAEFQDVDAPPSSRSSAAVSPLSSASTGSTRANILAHTYKMLIIVLSIVGFVLHVVWTAMGMTVIGVTAALSAYSVLSFMACSILLLPMYIVTFFSAIFGWTTGLMASAAMFFPLGIVAFMWTILFVFFGIAPAVWFTTPSGGCDPKCIAAAVIATVSWPVLWLEATTVIVMAVLCVLYGVDRLERKGGVITNGHKVVFTACMILASLNHLALIAAVIALLVLGVLAATQAGGIITIIIVGTCCIASILVYVAGWAVMVPIHKVRVWALNTMGGAIQAFAVPAFCCLISLMLGLILLAVICSANGNCSPTSLGWGLLALGVLVVLLGACDVYLVSCSFGSAVMLVPDSPIIQAINGRWTWESKRSHGPPPGAVIAGEPVSTASTAYAPSAVYVP